MIKKNGVTGFSLIEIIIVIAVLAALGAIAIPSLMGLLKTPEINTASEEIMNTLRLAQNKTLSSEANSQYGVYFKTTTTPHQYILFKGSSYALRDTAYDQVYPVPAIIEFSAINISGGNEIVFDRLTGTTAESGNVSLRLKEDHSQVKNIYVDNSGTISPNPLSVPEDTRVKDSRHVDLNYSRSIDTSNENIVLTFNGNIVENVPIFQNLNAGQIDWQGTFTVNNTAQTIRIHTLRLNSPDTQFSIFRDQRFNNASLTITLSGDNTGTLVEYSADGLTPNFQPSVYVSNFAWQ